MGSPVTQAQRHHIAHKKQKEDEQTKKTQHVTKTKKLRKRNPKTYKGKSRFSWRVISYCFWLYTRFVTYTFKPGKTLVSERGQKKNNYVKSKRYFGMLCSCWFHLYFSDFCAFSHINNLYWALVYLLPKTFKLFGFQNYWLWAYLMKCFPETSSVHALSSISTLSRFHH